MKPIPFSMKGTEYALTLKVTTYPEGNLAIKLYQESFGQLVFWDSLTANLGGLCPKDCGYINTKSTGKRFYAWIKRNGLGERTGQVRLEDGVEYVEYLFNAKKLKKLDPEGYTYYERRLKGELGRRYLDTICTFEEVFRHTYTPPMQLTGRPVSEIAYSRSDYDGHRWWTTWHDGPGKKAVPELVKEIDDFQNALFKLPAFKTLNTMRRFCRYAQATSEATEFNLYSETDHLYIWIRMITRFRDYNVYVHYYDRPHH